MHFMTHHKISKGLQVTQFYTQFIMNNNHITGVFQSHKVQETDTSHTDSYFLVILITLIKQMQYESPSAQKWNTLQHFWANNQIAQWTCTLPGSLGVCLTRRRS